MTKFEAIVSLYPTVVTLAGEMAYDANDSVVDYDHDRVEALLQSVAYQRSRKIEYPPITDYIDGVVKGDQAQIDAYIAACLAVKAKYPKPE